MERRLRKKVIHLMHYTGEVLKEKEEASAGRGEGTKPSERFLLWEV